MSDLGPLSRLALAQGIHPVWHDIWGNAHQVPSSTLRALLAAMHVPAHDDEQAQSSLLAHESGRWNEVLPAAVVVRQSGLPAQITLRLPAGSAQQLSWQLVEESGAEHQGDIDTRELAEIERSTVRGREFVAWRLPIEHELLPGYHRLRLTAQGERLSESSLIVAPDGCYEPPCLQAGARVWGPAVQLYALRSERNWGSGDFTDLLLVLEQWAGRGADVVGLNPLHALFPHNPEHASPYSPSSRLFLNPLYLDPERIGDAHAREAARRFAASAQLQASLGALRAVEQVDYRGVAAAKLSVLELLYAGFRERLAAGDSDEVRGFRAYQAREGQALRHHALFEALQEHFYHQDANVWGWPVWPERYRRPDTPEVARFAEQHVPRVELFEWLQWHSERQLAEAGRRAEELGLGVGLYGDLAVSVDRGGAEAWAGQEAYALGATLGAPPDDFNLQGQNWGLPPLIPARLPRAGFAPFIATLRAAMRHVGALRIDHVMGLMRLFWIPAGATPAEGAYVSYPLQDLLGILALESHRNRCLVIGEDLGTVPDEARAALADARALSYRLLYFSRSAGGEFSPPQDYPARALVAVTTHDLPTLAGYWEGRDLALRNELRLFPSEEVKRSQIAERARDRVRLLQALEREGLLPAGVSPDPAAVPTMTPELARAVHMYLARTPCEVLMVQLEDVLGEVDQINLPGTTSEYRNWRRKIALPLERWNRDPRFVQLCEALAAIRKPL